MASTAGLRTRQPAIGSALIVGGGMAGLSAAIALGQRGVEVTVVEESREWTGAAIYYHYRVVYAFEELGILDQVVACGNSIAPDAPSFWTRMYNARGDQLVLGAPVLSEDWRLPSTISIYRPVMSEIMTDAAKEQGVELLIGHSYESIEQLGDRVEVELTTGDRRSFDLLIGADGVNSGVRERFFSEVGGPHYIGAMAFRMMFEDAPERWHGGLHLANGTTVVTNMLAGRLFYLGMSKKMERRRVDQEEAHAIVRGVLDGYRPSAMFDSIYERVAEDIPVIVGPYEWIFVPPPWHRGRIVLIGDAVHATAPTIGSAGGMAVEDGVVLAQELTKTADVDAALRAYVERRGERTKGVVEASATLMRTHQEHRPPQEEAAIRIGALQKLVEPY